MRRRACWARASAQGLAALGLVGLLWSGARAQSTEDDSAQGPTPSWSGFVQAGYHAALLPRRGRAEQLAPLVQYTPAGNTFVLHAAHLAVTQALVEHVSATIELDMGYDATKTAAYPFQGSPFDVQEAFATYSSGALSFTAGKFASYEGIESIEGPLNANITRGYSYNLAEPNTHTGVKFHYTTETFDVGVGVVNGWDNLLDNNAAKTLIARVAVTPADSFTVNLNGTFGAEKDHTSDGVRLSLDLVGEWSVTPRFVLHFQANTGMDGLGGSARRVAWYVCGVQPLYRRDPFRFGARAEVFADPDGARAQLGSVTLINLAFTFAAQLSRALAVRVEPRADFATRPIFGRSVNPDRSQLSLALTVEYLF